MESHRLAVLFLDICGSTRYFAQHGEVAGRRMVESCLKTVVPSLEAQGGRVVKYLGDGVLVAFPGAEELVRGVHAAQATLHAANQMRPGEPPVRIHCGADLGAVAGDSGGDIFGDAVNVAARAMDIAGPDQLYVTDGLVADLPGDLRERTRRIGSFAMRGKAVEITLHEVLWKLENSTVVVSRSQLVPLAHLELDYGGRTLELVPEAVRFTLGRTPGNDLVIDDGAVSREHAEIVRRKGVLLLVDHSTNGTYLVPDQGEPRHLHRTEAPLDGAGAVRLGRDDGPVVRFRVQWRTPPQAN